MVRILLVSFGSEWHNDVWNVLAIESLVGDLEGYFGNNIQISTFRFYTEDDIDSPVYNLKSRYIIHRFAQ